MMSSNLRYLLPLLIIVGGVSLTARFYADELAVFPHAYHVEDEGLACGACHDASREGAPGLEMSACEDCHDDGPPPYAASPARALGIPFPHGLHAGVGACADCHEGTVGAGGATEPDAPLMSQGACMACHVENGVTEEGGCTPCHDDDDQAQQLPPWHDGGWRAEHSARMEASPFTGHGLDCTTCHGSDPCMDCHQTSKPMSHALHLDERDAECESCHYASADGLPRVDTVLCADCHEGTVQTEFLRGPRGRRLDLGPFPHQQHSAAVPCLACHANTAVDGALDDTEGEPLVAQPACDDCHRAQGVAVAEQACARCHGVDKLRETPPTHDALWELRHGNAFSLSQGLGHDQQDCALCHTREACTACHMSTRPADHNGLWRVRMHGEAAKWDRDRCTVCHETGSCIGCHNNTAPLSHVGAWEAVHGIAADARDNESCMACHSQGWCESCHNG